MSVYVCGGRSRIDSMSRFILHVYMFSLYLYKLKFDFHWHKWNIHRILWHNSTLQEPMNPVKGSCTLLAGYNFIVRGKFYHLIETRPYFFAI